MTKVLCEYRLCKYNSAKYNKDNDKWDFLAGECECDKPIYLKWDSIGEDDDIEFMDCVNYRERVL